MVVAFVCVSVFFMTNKRYLPGIKNPQRRVPKGI